MDKINPLQYITDTDPVPEQVLDASGWFETEYQTLEWNGLETSNRQYLEWYMAQGWTIYDRKSEWRVTGYSLGIPINTEFMTVYMKRRKLQAERVLGDMIREFTEAYNEGREINDKRYDELVQLYAVMLDKTESEINGLSTTVNDYDTVINAIIDALPDDFDAHKDDVDGLLDDWGDSMRADINTRFDNELAKARQGLVDRGMYNSTVWTSTSAGIETERSKALTDLEDKILERKLGAKDRLYVLKADIQKHILDAHHRLLGVLQDHALKPLEFRNSIFSAMLAMMERRTDDYPGLDGLANIAAQLGYSDGAATVAPTA